jgi:hypothetical protein
MAAAAAPGNFLDYSGLEESVTDHQDPEARRWMREHRKQHAHMGSLLGCYGWLPHTLEENEEVKAARDARWPALLQENLLGYVTRNPCGIVGDHSKLIRFYGHLAEEKSRVDIAREMMRRFPHLYPEADLGE